jgi:hypothetical protein
MKKVFAICLLGIGLTSAALPALAASQEEGAGISGGDVKSYTNQGPSKQTSTQAKIDQKSKENGSPARAEAQAGSE